MHTIKHAAAKPITLLCCKWFNNQLFYQQWFFPLIDEVDEEWKIMQSSRCLPTGIGQYFQILIFKSLKKVKSFLLFAHSVVTALHHYKMPLKMRPLKAVKLFNFPDLFLKRHHLRKKVIGQCSSVYHSESPSVFRCHCTVF